MGGSDTQVPLLKTSADGTNGYDAPNPDGTTVVGDYHTHGDYSWKDPNTGTVTLTGIPSQDNMHSDNFSPEDQNLSNVLGGVHPNYRSYLGTPSGAFKVYNPYTGKPSKL